MVQLKRVVIIHTKIMKDKRSCAPIRTRLLPAGPLASLSLGLVCCTLAAIVAALSGDDYATTIATGSNGNTNQNQITHHNHQQQQQQQQQHHHHHNNQQQQLNSNDQYEQQQHQQHHQNQLSGSGKSKKIQIVYIKVPLAKLKPSLSGLEDSNNKQTYANQTSGQPTKGGSGSSSYSANSSK